MNQSQGVQGTVQDDYPYCVEPVMEGAMVCKLVYPEVYYRIQPHVMMVCDEMDTNYIMPTQEMVEQMSDNIYNDVIRMYPDMEEYARDVEMSNVESAQFFFDDRDRDRDFDHRRRFRRRGVFRDLIDILLLTELFGRRRRFWF